MVYHSFIFCIEYVHHDVDVVKERMILFVTVVKWGRQRRMLMPTGRCC